MIHFLKHFFALTVGNSLIHFYVGWFGGYVGRQKIYKKMQEKQRNIFARSLIYTINNPIKNMKEAIEKDYLFFKNNIDNARLSTAVISQYSTDSLMGYGDRDFDKGGALLEEQQRGQILPLIEKYCASQKGKKVCEIGTGNGDLIAHLAKKFEDNTFVGADFSIKNAQEKHKEKNLEFVGGYALDLLQKIKPDVIFTCSTTCLFTPLELKAYLEVLSKNGATDFFINEPSWSGFYSDENSAAHSSHLEGAVWFHNYPAYFREFGYQPQELQAYPYTAPKSQRSDSWLNLIHFKKVA